MRLPAHGRLGMVFQEPRLLPWRTVEQNVRLAAPRGERSRARRAVRDARPRRASRPLSRRIVARSGAPRGAGARLCDRARSAGPRRAFRLARRRARRTPARRARRAGAQPSDHHLARHPRYRRSDRPRRSGLSAARRQPGARDRRDTESSVRARPIRPAETRRRSRDKLKTAAAHG